MQQCSRPWREQIRQSADYVRVISIGPRVALGTFNESVRGLLRIQILVKRTLQRRLALLGLRHLMAIEGNVIRRLLASLKSAQHSALSRIRSIRPETIALRSSQLVQVPDDRAETFILSQALGIDELDGVAAGIRVSVDPPRQPDGIGLGVDPARREFAVPRG